MPPANSLVRGLFSVNTLDGRIKVPFKQDGMNQYFDGSWKFGTAKLVFKHDKFFLHIPTTKEVADSPKMAGHQFNSPTSIEHHAS